MPPLDPSGKLTVLAKELSQLRTDSINFMKCKGTKIPEPL